MTNLFDILEVLGYFLRTLGSLVFGLGASWLTVRIFKEESPDWRVKLAANLGLLAAFVLVGHWVSGAAALGAFGLGAGGGLLLWGLAAGRGKADEDS